MLRPFPNDPRLTGIAIAFQNRELIADLVMPRVGVGQSTFKWLEYDFAQGVTVPATLVGRKGRPTEVEFTATDATGSTEDHALDDVVPNDDVAEAGPGLDPLGDATEGLTGLIALAREIRVAAKVADAGNFNHSSNLTGDNLFNDPDGNPISLIMDALATPLVRPNKAVTSQAVFNALRVHPKVVAAIAGAGTVAAAGMVSRQQLANLLELEEILIGAGWYNTAAPGQTPVYARVWGDNFTMFRRAPVVRTRAEPSWGFTAEFGTRVAKRIDEPKTGLRGAVRIRVGESVGEIVQSKEAAYQLLDVLA